MCMIGTPPSTPPVQRKVTEATAMAANSPSPPSKPAPEDLRKSVSPPYVRAKVTIIDVTVGLSTHFYF